MMIGQKRRSVRINRWDFIKRNGGINKCAAGLLVALGGRNPTESERGTKSRGF